MIDIFDETGSLNIEELIMKQSSFKKIMEDGIVTEEELEEQSGRVIDILKRLEVKCNDEQKELLLELLAEISVLIAINNWK